MRSPPCTLSKAEGLRSPDPLMSESRLTCLVGRCRDDDDDDDVYIGHEGSGVSVSAHMCIWSF